MGKELTDQQEKLLEKAKKSPRIGKVVLIASGFTVAGIVIAKAATKNNPGKIKSKFNGKSNPFKKFSSK